MSQQEVSLKDEIFRLTNQLRTEMHLPALREQEALNQVSLKHSQDMAERQYFDHISPEGKSPHERLETVAPQLLCASSGENIAQRSRGKQNNTELAQTLLTMWRESPGHYAQLISSESHYLGVGVAEHNGVVYATQTFADIVAELQTDLPESVKTGNPLVLNFDYLGQFPLGELSAFLQTPDPNTPITGEAGRLYRGKGPLHIAHHDTTFSIEIPTSGGSGTYLLRLGRLKQSYARPYRIHVVPY